MTRYKHFKHILTFLVLTLLFSASAFAAKTDFEKIAAEGTSEEIEKILTSTNAARTVIGKNKETFLMLLLKADRSYDIIESAIKAGCEVGIKTKDKKTSLMYAAMYSSDNNVISLIIQKSGLSKKARQKFILLKDNDKKNAFDYAMLNKNNPRAYIFLSEIQEDPDAAKRDFSGMNSATYSPASATSTKDFSDVEKNSPSASEYDNLSTKVITEPTDTEKEVPASTFNSEGTIIATIPESDATSGTAVTQTAPQIPEVTTHSQTYLYDYILSTTEEKSVSEHSGKTIINNPNLTDENGVSLLMKACKSGNSWEVKTLIENGANVNTRDKDGWTPLMYACRYQNNEELVNYLISAGAHIRVRNKYNTTPLIMAAQYNQNPEILRILLKNRKINENEVYNAFILAVSSNNGTDYIKTSKVKLFIDMDIPLNGTWKGMSPLMYACQYNSSTSVIKLLLDSGARISTVDSDGKRAFDYAKANKNLIHDEVYWSLNNSN